MTHKCVLVPLILARFAVSSGFKREGHTVDAEALTCRIRSIFKHMTQVGITILTKDLCPSATQAVVRATNDGGGAFVTLPCPMSLFECRPACPRVILSLWTEKWGIAADTVVHPHFKVVKVDPTEGHLCPSFSGDYILFWGQFLLPVFCLIVTGEWLQALRCAHRTDERRDPPR